MCHQLTFNKCAEIFWKLTQWCEYYLHFRERISCVENLGLRDDAASQNAAESVCYASLTIGGG